MVPISYQLKTVPWLQLLSATRWSVVRYEDRADISSLTTIPDILAMHPIPGLFESRLVLVSPESGIRFVYSLFSASAHPATVVSELSCNLKCS